MILLNDRKEQLEQALTVLGTEFPLLNWDFRPDPSSGKTELISQWLGDPADEIMLCAFTGSHIDERFHRQDFFFVNFAYRGNYEALSASSQNRISMKEGDCYLGQPYSGYALKKTAMKRSSSSASSSRRKHSSGSTSPSSAPIRTCSTSF